MITGAKLTVETENLAVPEVHVEGDKPKGKKTAPAKKKELSINYNTAVPEIIIGGK